MEVIPVIIFVAVVSGFLKLLNDHYKNDKKMRHLERAMKRITDPRIIYESFETAMKMTKDE